MKNRLIVCIFIIAFLVLTALTVLGDHYSVGITSSALSTRKTDIGTGDVGKGSVIRTDFVDENDVVTEATDKGYATVIRRYKGKKVILEEYFDAEGVPALLSSGYSAVSRSYNDRGQNVLITYLDADGEPVVTSNGYSSIHRTINDEGRADTDT